MKRHIKVSTHTTHTCIYIYIYIYACSEPKVHTVLQFRWLGSLYCSLKNSVLCAFHLCSFFAQLKLAPQLAPCHSFASSCQFAMERSLTLPPSEPMNTLRRFGWLCKYQDLTDPGLRRHREYMVLWIGFFNESTGQAGGPISFFRQATQWLGRRITLFVLSLSISVEISPTKREGLSSLQKENNGILQRCKLLFPSNMSTVSNI